MWKQSLNCTCMYTILHVITKRLAIFNCERKGHELIYMDVMNIAFRRRFPVLADIFCRLRYMERCAWFRFQKASAQFP